MRVLLRWIIGAAALFVTVKIGEALHLGLAFQAHGTTGSFVSALVFVLVLTLVNAFIRPIVNFFTAPLNCLTFGLFSFVVNAVLFWFVGRLMGLEVNNFIAALFGSVVLSLVSGLLNAFIVEKNDR